ncbi:MAG: ThuA domain-containing protein [Clostridiales bacterium]|jgi:trehalose utilization protein|nr:ThuA domain-containing protein [Clostridiales bacterium]
MNITIWNENYGETHDEEIRATHPEGIHGTLAGFLREIPGSKVRTAVLQDPEAGLPDDILNSTDVLLWWGHIVHHLVPDELVEKIHDRVLRGMGMVVLHSAHHSKIFRRLMGTTCDLRWREGCYARLFNLNPAHPIASGVPENFELGAEECYGEFFDIPAPDDLIFGSWYDSGEIFRSGCAWRRGYGKIFYFQPGHETNRAYYHPVVRRILQNACLWAAPQVFRSVEGSPQLIPTLEEIRAGKE